MRQNIDQPVPTHINTWFRAFNGMIFRNANNPGGPTTTNWTTANAAVFIPFYLTWPYVIRRFFWGTGTAAPSTGNVDMGIYSPGGQRLCSLGSTSNASAASTILYASLTNPYVLSPGLNYLAYVMDNTTVSNILGTSSTLTARFTEMSGMLVQASAFPLPKTATFAAPSVNSHYPLAGFTNTPSGGVFT